jgi:NAD(P)H-hydrate epimerase
VLVVGGNRGYSGAARLAAEAAARSGAGLVSVATHPAHAATLNLGRPELMCRGVERPAEFRPLLERAKVIALGPGLGQDGWAKAMFQAALESGLPLVVDADALNLLAAVPLRRDDWVLTPHPGEAARLLNSDTRTLQADRFAALQRLRDQYGGVAVLKGAGSLIGSGGSRPPAVCSDGNPGMASGGSGDLLTGLIAGLAAQGHELIEAAELGVALHAAAGDRAALRGEIGMLAGDIMEQLRGLLNGGQSGGEA